MRGPRPAPRRPASELADIVGLGSGSWGREALVVAAGGRSSSGVSAPTTCVFILATNGAAPQPTLRPGGRSNNLLTFCDVLVRQSVPNPRAGPVRDERRHRSGSGSGPRGLHAPAQAGAHPADGGGGLPDRQDPALDPRGVPAHAGRGGDCRPRRLQPEGPPQAGRVPGHQDPGAVPARHPPRLPIPSTTWPPWSGCGPARTPACWGPPAPAKATC